MERREQVFVSSTYMDLVEERQEIIQTLLEADCFPAGMELFPASDDDRWTLIRRVIDDSDYYLVVVGGRYGSVDPDRGLSYTEMEFDYAVEAGKPVLGFLHGNPGGIEADKSELDPDTRAKLEVFRGKVEKRIVKYWESSKELGGQVAKSLMQARKTHPTEGWIRARDALTPDLATELAELRARVKELEAELQETRSTAMAADLAQGDDIFELHYKLEYWSQADVSAGTDRRYTSSTIEAAGDVEVTWDGIFAELGAHMLNEATERALELALRSVAIGRMSTPRDLGRAEDFSLVGAPLRDVVVQLYSLGLIAQSSRRRAVSDKNTYWTLTQAGRDHLMRLRAIRRPETRAATAKKASRAPTPRKVTSANVRPVKKR